MAIRKRACQDLPKLLGFGSLAFALLAIGGGITHTPRVSGSYFDQSAGLASASQRTRDEVHNIELSQPHAYLVGHTNLYAHNASGLGSEEQAFRDQEIARIRTMVEDLRDQRRFEQRLVVGHHLDDITTAAALDILTEESSLEMLG